MQDNARWVEAPAFRRRAETVLFHRKNIRVETVFAPPARTSIRCDASKPTTPSPWSFQVVISVLITKTGIKPKTTAQTKKAETIRMSCLHKAQRPMG
jgi:hypothetical protein